MFQARPKGFAPLAVVVALVVIAVAVLGGAYYFSNSQDFGGEPEAMMEKEEVMIKEDEGVVEDKDDAMMNDDEGATPGDTIMEKDDEVMEEKPLSFMGARLAGNSSPLIDFNSSDYQKAIASDKLVVLYFYANWCPICRAEFPKAEAAFNQLTTDNVVGFRANFNDNETDSAEEALARQFGVAYQHTKVFVKNGERVLKSPETWETSRYLTEINARIN